MADVLAELAFFPSFSCFSCSWYFEMSRTRLTVSDLLAPAYIVLGRSSLFLRWILDCTGLLWTTLVVVTDSAGVGLEGGLFSTLFSTKVLLPEELSVSVTTFSGMSRSEQAFFRSLGTFSNDVCLSMLCSGRPCELTFVLYG